MRTLIISLFLGAVCASQVRYDNFKVFRVRPENEDHIKALQQLQATNLGYDFWTDGIGLVQPVDVMVPPHMEFDFKDFLKLRDLKSEVYIQNVQDKIDKERAAVRSIGMDWLDYHSLDEIYDWLHQLVNIYPDKVTIINAGTSYEGRDIKGVRISFSDRNENNAVFIEGGIHAREFISPAVVTYTINQILTNEDEDVRKTVEEYDWYIFPVFNPDGYNYAKNIERMWRKTRVPYGACYGADPNRNWNYRWNTGGASNNPCSNTFAGPHPESEPEVASMSKYISSIQQKLIAYISFHSYGQLLLLPFGHTSDRLANYYELKDVGTIAMDKLESVFGTPFRVGNTAEILYVATGTSTDWVKAKYGTRITYTYELRDTGNDGFVLPPDQILDSGTETFASLITILDEFKAKS